MSKKNKKKQNKDKEKAKQILAAIFLIAILWYGSTINPDNLSLLSIERESLDRNGWYCTYQDGDQLYVPKHEGRCPEAY